MAAVFPIDLARSGDRSRASLELAPWEVDAVLPGAEPYLDRDLLAGNPDSYPACRAEARRLREEGHSSLRAPSAAVMSGRAECYGVAAASKVVTETVPSEVFVFFGAPDRLVGMPLADGHPEPRVLSDVRPHRPH
jgi:hypothetical protein